MKAKRILSLVLALAMVVTMFSVFPVSAAGEPELLLGLDFNAFDFENNSITATGSLVANKPLTVNVPKSLERTNGLNGQTAVSLPDNDRTQKLISWLADDCDPFAAAKGGITISMMIKPSKIPQDWQFLMAYGVDGLHPGNGTFTFHNLTGSEVVGHFGSDGSLRDQVGIACPLVANEWQMLTITADANGNYQFYVNNKAAGSHHETALKDIAASVNNAATADNKATYALFSTIRDHWGDPNFYGSVQSVAYYDGVMNSGQVANMYMGTLPMDQEKVNEVIAKIQNALNAEGNAQLAAFTAAVSAYNELNAREQENVGVDNYSKFMKLKEDLIAATDIIVGFEYNGNLNEILDRTTVQAYAPEAGATFTDGALELSGASNGASKQGGFYRRDYPVFSKATENGITLEMRVKLNALNNDKINLFGFSRGFTRRVHLWANQNGSISATTAGDDFPELGHDGLTETSEPGVLTVGEWQTVTMVQSYPDAECVLTEIYVDGALALTSNGLYDLRKMDADGDKDDIYFVGATDGFDTFYFDGLIDSFYAYNYAKSFTADYSKVDAALAAVPADLTGYTEASVKAVEAAVNTVVRDLTVDKQAEVDAYAAAINEAVANLISKELEMSISISDTAVVAFDTNGRYNLTWNATVALGEKADLTYINDNAKFKEYGVIYGISDDAVNALADGLEITQAKVLEFAKGDDIDVYTIFGFRLKNVPVNANRAAMFYITYELNGQTYTIYSDIMSATAVIS